jgi:hypothetical protein
MSTGASDSESQRLTVIQNDQDETVTFAPDRPHNLTLPATEWLTAGIDDLVDLHENR